MGFLDKAKAIALDAKTNLDQTLSTSTAGKDAERHFRDFGVLAYLKETGRDVNQADWDRVFAALQSAESSQAITSFALQTSPPPPPGALAAGVASPPPGPGMAPPPPGATMAPPPPPGAVAASTPQPPPGFTAPPPPPPPPPAG